MTIRIEMNDVLKKSQFLKDISMRVRSELISEVENKKILVTLIKSSIAILFGYLGPNLGRGSHMQASDLLQTKLARIILSPICVWFYRTRAISF